MFKSRFSMPTGYRPTCRATGILFAVLAALSAARADGQPLMYEVKLFGPVAPYEYTTPFGMNEAGRVVGYTAWDAFDPSATGVVVDPGTGIATLSLVDPNYNFPYGINAAGAIVGQSGQQGFHFHNGVATPLPPPDGFFSNVGHDINDAGAIVGSYGDSDFSGPQHCYWSSSAATPQTLIGIIPGLTFGSAWAINEAGQIAGVSGNPEGVFFAVRWNSPNADPVQIGPLPGAFNSEALGMNELGDVVGRSSFEDFSTQAFFWNGEDGFLTGLGYLPGGNSYSEAFDVNDIGQVVGSASAPGFEAHAFLWEGGVMYDLNDYIAPGGPSFRYLSRAGAINNAGVIAAEAVIGETGFPRAIAILTPMLAGDLNCDGAIDVEDAGPLALALVDPAGYAAQFPGCNPARADIDGDGQANGNDVQVFVDGLLND